MCFLGSQIACSDLYHYLPLDRCDCYPLLPKTLPESLKALQ